MTDASTAIDAPRFDLDRVFYRVLQTGMLALIFVAPLFLGGRHPTGALVYLGLISALGCIALAKSLLKSAQLPRLTPIDVLLIAGLGLVALQLIPLPGWLLQWISLGAPEKLHLWFTRGEEVALGSWHTISIVPEATRYGLALLFAYAVLFRVVASQFTSLPAIHRLLRWIGYSAAFMAVLGIIHKLVGNGKILWIYQHPYLELDASARGPFTTPNHYAHFLALGIGPLVWLLLTDRPQRQKPLRGKRSLIKKLPRKTYFFIACLTLVVLAGVFSLSRAGAICLLLASLTALAAGFYTTNRARNAFWSCLSAGIIALAFLVFTGFDTVYSSITDISLDSAAAFQESTGRTAPWAAAIQALPDFWIAGSGVGTYQDLYKTYLDRDLRVEYTYAESGYLQIAVESGLLGLLLLVAALGMIVFWSQRTLKDKRYTCVAAILPGILVSVLHSIVDFVWFIPACITTTLILVACLYNLYQLNEAESAHELELQSPLSQKLSRWFAIEPYLLPDTQFFRRLYRSVALACCLCVVLLMLNLAWRKSQGHLAWESYLASHSIEESLEPELDDDDARLSRLGETIQALESTLAQNNKHDRAHLRLSEALLHKFQLLQKHSPNQLGLEQIADAARSSGYEDAESVRQWLQRALGENHKLLYRSYAHAYQGASLCPMVGEAYIYLGQLDFLFPDSGMTAEKLIQQALTVRPYDGELLYTAALLSQQTGRIDESFELLSRAFRLDAKVRSRIIEVFGQRMPPDEFNARIQPDLDGQIELIRYYTDQDIPLFVTETAEIYFDQVRSQAPELPPQERLYTLKRAKSMSDFLKKPDLALEFCTQAVELAPTEYPLRRELAKRLLRSGQNEQALTHLRWCLARTPRNGKVREEIRLASQAPSSVSR